MPDDAKASIERRNDEIDIADLRPRTARSRKTGFCTASLAGKPFHRTEVLLGLSKPDGSTVTEAEFQRFIDTEVTPRFPDGFTVVAGSGQFKGSDGAIVQESARVLVVLHPVADSRSSQSIEEIRASYKYHHQQHSVARVDGESCASF